MLRKAIDPSPRPSPHAVQTSVEPGMGRGRLDGPIVRRALSLVAVWLGSVLVLSAEFNPPIGPHVNPDPSEFAQVPSYEPGDRVVLTPYFYWYDVYSGAHIFNPDGSDALTTHPPTMTGFSYLSRAWHRQQLLDMIDAGIDVLLPVYWGEPSQRIPDQPVTAQPWSYAGLPPLVQARDELLAEGLDPPRIGLFYDTSTLEWNSANRQVDLTTGEGRQWFYESIRDFFSLIPPRHWALVEGRPIVFLYAASFAAAYDQTSIEFTQQAFAADFAGRTPHIVREISWNLETDQIYAWGGALGLKNPGVASLGPGYDHSAVPGRAPLIVDREEGAFFERNWIRFLRNPSPWVMIETWNEFHEGTDIAASREYGRQYIELNRHYVDLFKAGIRPPRPRGAYSDFQAVRVTLGAVNDARGLTQIEHADGLTEPAVIADRECRSVVPTEHGGRYIYLRIDDSFKWADRMLADLEVEYFDGASGSFRIEYDGSDPNAPFQGAYTAAPRTVNLTGTGQWRTARFRLPDARFLNSQNGGADLRIAVSTDTFHVRTIVLSRFGVPDEAGTEVHGWQTTFDQPLDPDWQITRTDTGTFLARDGLLAIRPVQATPVRATALPVPESTDVELLARIRVLHAPAAGLLGGLTAGVTSDPESGVHFQFSLGQDGMHRVALGGHGLPDPPSAEFAWETNRWYWLRFRHQTNQVTGYPDLWGRIWRADGETPEPIHWTFAWDYWPNFAPRHGRPGLTSGTVPDASLDCDYLLVKQAGMPRITAVLPELKPARPNLVPLGFSPDGGFQIEVRGVPEVLWVLQASSNLRTWDDVDSIWAVTDSVAWVDLDPGQLDRRFYRLRLGP
jgi:hypothetical protein